jgi:hypothetical protein
MIGPSEILLKSTKECLLADIRSYCVISNVLLLLWMVLGSFNYSALDLGSSFNIIMPIFYIVEVSCILFGLFGLIGKRDNIIMGYTIFSLVNAVVFGFQSVLFIRFLDLKAQERCDRKCLNKQLFAIRLQVVTAFIFALCSSVCLMIYLFNGLEDPVIIVQDDMLYYNDWDIITEPLPIYIPKERESHLYELSIREAAGESSPSYEAACKSVDIDVSTVEPENGIGSLRTIIQCRG